MDILQNNVFIPENLDSLFKSTGRIGGVTTRYLSQFTVPEAGENGYKPGNIIRFRFPSSFIDFSRHYLQFTTTISATGGTYLRGRWNAATNFIRARILFGSTEVCLVDNLPLIDSIIQLTKSMGTIQSTNAVIRGTGDTSTRNGQANNGQIYCVYLGDTLKLLSRALPLQFIQTTLTIELTVNDSILAIETDGTNPQLTINNLQWHYDELQLDESLSSAIKSQIQKNLCIPFINYHLEQNTSQTVGVLRLNSQLSFKYICLAGLIAVARNSANFAANVNDVYIKYEGYNSLVSNYVKINNMYIPADKNNSVISSATELISYLGCMPDHEHYIFYNWPQYFVSAFTFMQDSNVLEDKDPSSYVQGVSASLAGFSLQYNVELSVNPHNLQYDFFAASYSCLKINGDGSITFSQ